MMKSFGVLLFLIIGTTLIVYLLHGKVTAKEYLKGIGYMFMAIILFCSAMFLICKFIF